MARMTNAQRHIAVDTAHTHLVTAGDALSAAIARLEVLSVDIGIRHASIPTIHEAIKAVAKATAQVAELVKTVESIRG